MALPKTHFKIIAALSLAGTLFSGYLSATKFLTGTCAFNETCPYFLGYPACWYGLGLFLIMLIASAMALSGAVGMEAAAKAIMIVSLAGTLFAGGFVLQEAYRWAASAGSPSYGLILPSCAYGLVFFIVLFIISAKMIQSKKL